MEQAQKKQNRAMMYFFILVAFQSVVANFAHPATPTIITNLGLPDYMFGVAFAGMSITHFLFSPFFGKISDQIGRRRVIMIAAIGYAGGQAMFGLSTTELGILAARMVGGFFIGGFMVGQMSYIIDNSAVKDKGKNFTLYATIQSVCGAVGYLLGGYLSEISIPMMFTIQVIGLVIYGVLTGILCTDNPYKVYENKIDVKSTVKGANPFGAFFTVGKQLTKVLVVLLVVTLFASFSVTAYDQCFNFFIKDQLSFSPANNGMLRGGLGILAFAVNMTLGMYIMKRTNIYKSLVWVLGVFAVTLIGLLFPTALVIFVIINMILYSLNALYNPLIQATFAQGVTDERQSGAFMGVFSSVKALGQVVGSLFAGFIYSTGPRLSFLYAMVGFIIATMAAYVAYREKLKNK